MTTTPKRRWFSYSLRTLFVVVALTSAGFAWIVRQSRFVEERRLVIEEISQMERIPGNKNVVLFGCVQDKWMADVRSDIPWTWRLLGAQAAFKIILDSADYTEADAKHYAVLFPETCIDLNAGTENVLSICPARWR